MRAGCQESIGSERQSGAICCESRYLLDGWFRHSRRSQDPGAHRQFIEPVDSHEEACDQELAFLNDVNLCRRTKRPYPHSAVTQPLLGVQVEARRREAHHRSYAPWSLNQSTTARPSRPCLMARHRVCIRFGAVFDPRKTLNLGRLFQNCSSTS